jgi:integrase
MFSWALGGSLRASVVCMDLTVHNSSTNVNYFVLGLITGPVFLNAAGKPYTQPPQPFRDTVETLGLNEGRDKRDRVVFHTLRHTAATRLAQAGTTLPDLQALGGWKSPIMALRYAHDDKRAKRKAMAALEAMTQVQSGKVIDISDGNK